MVSPTATTTSLSESSVEGRIQALIEQTGERFQCGEGGKDLAIVLLSYLFRESEDGFAGFLERCELAVGPAMVSRWVGATPNQSLLEPSPLQLEALIGSGTLQRIIQRSGLPWVRAVPALTFLLPRVVALLTPDGIVPPPAGSPSWLSSFVGRPEKSIPNDVPTTTIRDTPRSLLGAVLPLAALGLVSYLGYRLLKSPPPPPPAASSPVEQAALPAGSVAPSERASLSIRSDSTGNVEYAARVSDNETKLALISVLESMYGAAVLHGGVVVDPLVEPAPWIESISAAVNDLRTNGLEVLIRGRTVLVGGLVSPDLRSYLIGRLSSALGDWFSVRSFEESFQPLILQSIETRTAALSGLAEGYTREQLGQALGDILCTFTPESSAIPTETIPFLDAAAHTLLRAPAGTVIEVGGHTDAVGESAALLALSESRAAAVRQALLDRGVPSTMLVTKGYGSTRPVASNETEVDRLQNRRISFVLVE